MIAEMEASSLPATPKSTDRSPRLQDAQEFVDFIGRLSSSLVSRFPSSPTTPVSPTPSTPAATSPPQWTTYAVAAVSHVPPSNPPSRSHKHSSLNSPGHIPRPENEWMIFRREFNERLRAANTPGHAADVSKVAGAIWRGMSEDEKRPYRIKATEGRARHAKMYPDYKYRPKPPRAKVRRQKRGPPAIEIPAPFAEMVPARAVLQEAGEGGGAVTRECREDSGELQADYTDEDPDDEDPRYAQIYSEPSSPQETVFAKNASLKDTNRVTPSTDSVQATSSSPSEDDNYSIFPPRNPESPIEDLGPRWPWKHIDYSVGSYTLPYPRHPKAQSRT